MSETRVLICPNCKHRMDITTVSMAEYADYARRSAKVTPETVVEAALNAAELLDGVGLHLGADNLRSAMDPS